MTGLSSDDAEFVDQIRGIATDLTGADHELTQPPPGLWDRIEQQLTLEEPSSVRLLFNRALPVVAVAAAVIAVVAAAVLFTRDGSDARFIAEVAIVNDGLPVVNPDAGVAVLREVDGRLVLDVDVPELPEVRGFYELWIIDTDVVGMQSLGVVTGDGRHPMPNGIDPAAFPVVDVSVEPPDGDPTHSGQSIWRGVLEL